MEAISHPAVSDAERTILDGQPRPVARRRGRPPLDPEGRRQRIIAVASDLFIRHGYAETTVESVGKASGVTKRTIYGLIGDKAALFRAVCDHCHVSIKQMRVDLPLSTSGLRQSLLDLAGALIAHALADETIAVERAVVLEQVRFPDLMNSIMGNSRGELNKKIAVFFEELIERAMIGPIDTFKTSEIFFDVVVGNAGFRKTLGFDEPAPDPADIAERVDIFIEGHLRRHGLAGA